MPALSVGDVAQALSVMGILALIIVTGSRRTWVWFSVVEDERRVSLDRLDEMRRDRDEWKTLAQTAAATNSTLTQQNEKLAGVVETLTRIVDVRGVPR